jgi:hypothetical protein
MQVKVKASSELYYIKMEKAFIYLDMYSSMAKASLAQILHLDIIMQKRHIAKWKKNHE